MGWRERDYARLTKDEQRQLFGGTARGSRVGLRPGVGSAIAASLLLLVLGHFPRGHPFVPALHFTIPSLHQVRELTHSGGATPAGLGKISVPRVSRVGSFLTFHGQLPTRETGTVSVEGVYVRGLWETLAIVPTTEGSYTARIHLTRTGLLHLRITHPDGHRSVGSIRVVC